MRLRIVFSFLLATLTFWGCGFGPRDPGDVVTNWYAAKTLTERLRFFTDDAQVLDYDSVYAGVTNPPLLGINQETTIVGWLERRETVITEIDQGAVSGETVTWREKRTERNQIDYYAAEATIVDGKIHRLQYTVIGLPSLFVSLTCRAQALFPPLEGLAPNPLFDDSIPGQSTECPAGPFIPMRHLQNDEAAIRTLIERTADNPVFLNLKKAMPISFEIENGGNPIWITFEIGQNPPINSADYLKRIAMTPSVTLTELVATAALPIGISDLEVAIAELKKHSDGDVECFQTVVLRNPGPAALVIPPKTVVVQVRSLFIYASELPPVLMPHSSIDVVARTRTGISPPERVLITADPESDISESNEGNNQIEFMVPLCGLVPKS